MASSSVPIFFSCPVSCLLCPSLVSDLILMYFFNIYFFTYFLIYLHIAVTFRTNFRFGSQDFNVSRSGQSQGEEGNEDNQEFHFWRFFSFCDAHGEICKVWMMLFKWISIGFIVTRIWYFFFNFSHILYILNLFRDCRHRMLH